MPSAGKLTIATCQHPIEPEIRRNLTHILELMRTSRERGADIAYFPECNLSGYAGEESEEINRADLKILLFITGTRSSIGFKNSLRIHNPDE